MLRGRATSLTLSYKAGQKSARVLFPTQTIHFCIVNFLYHYQIIHHHSPTRTYTIHSNMRFFSIIGPLATLAAVVSTLAVHQGTHRIGRISNPLEYSSRGGSVIKRADPGMSFCTDADSQGLCYKDVSAFGTCGTCPVLAELPCCAAIS